MSKGHLYFCRNCNRDVVDEGNGCPDCGARLGGSDPSSDSGGKGCSALAFVLVGVGTLLLLGGGVVTAFLTFSYSNSGYGSSEMHRILAVPEAIALAGIVMIVTGIAVAVIRWFK